MGAIHSDRVCKQALAAVAVTVAVLAAGSANAETWDYASGDWKGQLQVNLGVPTPCTFVHDNGAKSQGTCTIVRSGTYVSMQFDSGNAEYCQFFGTINGQIINGLQLCKTAGGPWQWNVRILP